jgi:hypothetical protein
VGRQECDRVDKVHPGDDIDCDHDWSDRDKRVSPPKHVSFEIRYQKCRKCERVQATDKQRQRNRKQANYAYNVWLRQYREQHGN